MNTYTLKFETLADVTSYADVESSVEQYVGQAKIAWLTNLPTDMNVRGYLAENPKHTTDVHKAIYTTLDKDPMSFGILNGGITIITASAAVDTAEGLVVLEHPSVIDGAQTLGTAQRYLTYCAERGIEPNDAVVKIEILVTQNIDLAVKTSVSRNTRNPVKGISTAAREGRFEDLAVFLENAGLRLQTSESDRDPSAVPIDRLLQAITCLIPSRLWMYGNDPSDRSKVYNRKSAILNDWTNLCKVVFGEVEVTPEEFKRHRKLYEFCVEYSVQAWGLYRKWKTHPGFAKIGIRNGITVMDGSVVNVNDGLVFPALTALSIFIEQQGGGWEMKYPEGFNDQDLIDPMKRLFTVINGSSPTAMGRKKQSYAALMEVTKTYQRVSKRLTADKKTKKEAVAV